MKRLCLVVFSLMLVLAAGPLVNAQEAAKPTKPAMAMPAADGEKLSQYIMQDSPYSKWELFPGTKRMYKGTEPHGALLTTYVNSVAMNSIKKKAGYAEGSIIVKENYSPDKNLAALTVMYKVKGYSPEDGDWFWLRSAPDGKVGTAGKVDGCIKCHAKAKATDYVFSKTPK